MSLHFGFYRVAFSSEENLSADWNRIGTPDKSTISDSSLFAPLLPSGGVYTTFNEPNAGLGVTRTFFFATGRSKIPNPFDVGAMYAELRGCAGSNGV